MSVKIGAKIKILRKRDDITQERLAEVLGVTNQAVSKWESGNSYPDIEYITPIANFFNVTVDYLFDHDKAEKQRKIADYQEQFYNLRFQTHYYDEQIDLMRSALAEFPAEEKLLVNLATGLFEKWFSKGLSYLTENGYTYPDYKWHKSLDSWEESMKILEGLLATSTDDAVRSKCRYHLSMIYGRTGEKEKLLAIVEKFDSIYFSKENILHFTLFGEEGVKNNQQYLFSILSLLKNIFFLIFIPEPEHRESRVEVFNILINLYKFIFRDDEVILLNPIGELYHYIAYSLQYSNPEEAITALEQSFTYAKVYDEVDVGDGEKKYTSPYMNRLTYSNEKLGERNKVRTLMDRFKNGEFIKLRGNTRFIALFNEVEAWIDERR